MSWYRSDLAATGTGRGVGETSGPYADLELAVEGETGRTVKLEDIEVVGKLVEFDAAVEAATRTRMDEVTLAGAFEFRSGVLGKDKSVRLKS